MEHEIVLWKKGSESAASRVDGKFIGKHNFSFSIPFPTRFRAVPLASLKERDDRISFATISPFLSSISSPLDKPRPYGNLHQSAHSFQTKKSTQIFDEMNGPTQQQGAAMVFEEPVSGEDSYPTPLSFRESHTAANIQYELSAHLNHGRFRPDSKYVTP